MCRACVGQINACIYFQFAQTFFYHIVLIWWMILRFVGNTINAPRGPKLIILCVSPVHQGASSSADKVK